MSEGSHSGAPLHTLGVPPHALGVRPSILRRGRPCTAPAPAERASNPLAGLRVKRVHLLFDDDGFRLHEVDDPRHEEVVDVDEEQGEDGKRTERRPRHVDRDAIVVVVEARQDHVRDELETGLEHLELVGPCDVGLTCRIHRTGYA
eukprot:8321947-Heterocapsa_arctica.AAC.1